MKIIIVGDGQVGDTLIQTIAAEGHSVTVIDKNAALISRVVNQYDVLGIAGNGANQEILLEAGADSADIFIAVTNSDELNIVACVMAKHLGAARTVARVRDPDYFDEKDILNQNVGIDLVVNPERDTAREIVRLIRFPNAMKVEEFARRQVDMAEIYIDENHPLAGCRLNLLTERFGIRVLVCTIKRKEEVYIPSGDFTIESGDTISITASRTDLSAFFAKLGLLDKPIKSVMILGGGRISFYLAESLLKEGVDMRIVESDENRAAELSAALPRVGIILGDCTDSDVLEEEGIDSIDACVALTDNDEENAILSMFARTRKVDRIITKIDRLSFLRMLPQIGLDCTVSPRQLSAQRVLRFLRGQENRKKAIGKGEKESENAIRSLYKLCDGKAEALEFNVKDSFAARGIPFMSPEFRLKPNSMIASIIRNGTVVYPHGLTTLETGDSVVVVTTNMQLCELNDILA